MILFLAAVALGHQLPVAPPAQVGGSHLVFSPADPDAGATIEVRYRPARLLGSEEVLRLRARFRSTGDGSYNRGMDQVDAALLRPAADGSFRGSFKLDPAVVYAVFAVEDTSGSRVDHNDRRLWELLVHDVDGRPLADALLQKSNDLMGRNWRAAYQAARLRRNLYPDSPDAWNILRFFEAQVLPPDSLATALEAHRARLVEFDRALRGAPDVEPDVIATLMWYARGVKDTILEARWKARLLAEAPTQTHALQERIVFDLLPAHREDPADRLAALEALWHEADPDPDDITGPGYSHLLGNGLRAAVEVGDEEAKRRWAERHRLAGREVHLGPDTPEGVRAEIATVNSDLHANRPLTMTIPERKRRLEAPLQRTLSRLGDALLVAGDTAAALEAYQKAAAREAWDAGFFTRLADLLLELGDGRNAAELLARIAADPAADVPADTLRMRAGDAVTDTEWAELRRAGWQRLRGMVLAEAVDRPLPEDPALTGSDGRWATLSSLTGGKPTLVAFWSRFCGPSLEALPALGKLARELEAAGVPTLAVTDEPPSSELMAFLEDKGLEHLSVHHDSRREASQGFNQWGTPEYFLLDAHGRIRFQYGTLDDVRRQVRVLLDP